MWRNILQEIAENTPPGTTEDVPDEFVLEKFIRQWNEVFTMNPPLSTY